MSFEPIEKNDSQQHWLKSYGLKSQTVSLVTGSWIAVFLLLAFFSVDTYLDAKISDPLNFQVRRLLGYAPKQDERLKIYAIDDDTFAMLGKPMPSLELWGDILSAIAERRPRLIVIDAMFSENAPEFSQRAKLLFENIGSLGVPVVTGGFPDVSLEFKVPFDLRDPRYDIGTYVGPDLKPEGSERILRDHVPQWQDLSPEKFYGPGKVQQTLFKDVGHFWLKDEHKVAPFLRFADKVVPHMSLFAASSLEFKDRKLVIDAKAVALDSAGNMPVNFLHRGDVAIKGMVRLIKDAQEGYVADQVNAGDVVLLLPMYYTGNADMRPTPFGMLPGGIYLASLINSVLTGRWLQPVEVGDALTVVMSVLAAAFAYLAPARWFLLLWMGAALGLLASCQIIFSVFGLAVPYVLPILSGSVIISHIFFLKVRGYERKAAALRVALEGSVSPSQMDVMSKNPDHVNLEPRERVLTLMFIDIVGFSLSSENMLPRMAFENLKNILAEISNIIYAHGGVIDKTLGDGLLCYFGYRLESDETVTDHPEKAVQCAAEIQEKVLAECLEAIKTGAPLYPVRIGVNTASCYLGDIGSGRRIEFTVVGNGVNFAKRLESSCDIFKVMIGATTFDMIKGLPVSSENISKKMIKIKHHTELIDAYEFAPLALRQEDCDQAIHAFRWATSLQRVHERMPVNDTESLIVDTSLGPASVVNFSGKGISLLFNSMVPIGDNVQLTLDSRRNGLSRELKRAGLDPIVAESRWCYRAARGYVHGMMFVGLTVEQQDEFKRLVTLFAFSDSSETSGGEGDDTVKVG